MSSAPQIPETEKKLTFREKFNSWAALAILVIFYGFGITMACIGIAKGVIHYPYAAAGIIVVVVLTYKFRKEIVQIIATALLVSFQTVKYTLLIGIPLLILTAVVMWAWRTVFGH